MPKAKPKKRAASDSDSDSGPDDRGPVQKKPAPASSAKEKKTDEEPSFALERNKFIKVREFRGKVYVDIREYYEKDGELLPGKKGIALSAAAFQKLKEVIPDVDEALSKL